MFFSSRGTELPLDLSGMGELMDTELALLGIDPGQLFTLEQLQQASSELLPFDYGNGSTTL